ncbi:hypothetical protein Hanom_Chr02g00167741 [Helianthus anomalus]
MNDQPPSPSAERDRRAEREKRRWRRCCSGGRLQRRRAAVVAVLRRHLLPPFPLRRPLCDWCLVVVALGLGLVAVALGMVVEPGGRRWLSRSVVI